jgi:hypothetical protein
VDQGSALMAGVERRAGPPPPGAAVAGRPGSITGTARLALAGIGETGRAVRGADQDSAAREHRRRPGGAAGTVVIGVS